MEPSSSSSSSSPKQVADNPFEIPELYNIILQNTASNDLAALMSTSQQMVQGADRLISIYNRPLVKKILKSEENTKKGNEHIAHNDNVQFIEYLLWYWKLLDHRFLSLTTLWFEWARSKPISEYSMTDERWYRHGTLAVLSTMAKECYKSLRRTEFVEEIRQLMAPLSPTSRQPTAKDYETLGLAGAVAFHKSPPDYFLDEMIEVRIMLLYMKPELHGFDEETPEMSAGFDALVRSRLAFMGCLIYWIHHKVPRISYYGKSTNDFWMILEWIREGCLNDDEWRHVSSICENYAKRVHEMSKMATQTILKWRFGEDAVQKLEDQQYGDLAIMEVSEPLQFRLTQLNADFFEMCAREVLIDSEKPNANYSMALVDLLDPPNRIAGRKVPPQAPLTNLDQLLLKQFIEKFVKGAGSLKLRMYYHGMERKFAEILRQIIADRKNAIEQGESSPVSSM